MAKQSLPRVCPVCGNTVDGSHASTFWSGVYARCRACRNAQFRKAYKLRRLQGANKPINEVNQHVERTERLTATPADIGAIGVSVQSGPGRQRHTDSIESRTRSETPTREIEPDSEAGDLQTGSSSGKLVRTAACNSADRRQPSDLESQDIGASCSEGLRASSGELPTPPPDRQALILPLLYLLMPSIGMPVTDADGLEVGGPSEFDTDPYLEDCSGGPSEPEVMARTLGLDYDRGKFPPVEPAVLEPSELTPEQLQG